MDGASGGVKVEPLLFIHCGVGKCKPALKRCFGGHNFGRQAVEKHLSFDQGELITNQPTFPVRNHAGVNFQPDLALALAPKEADMLLNVANAAIFESDFFALLRPEGSPKSFSIVISYRLLMAAHRPRPDSLAVHSCLAREAAACVFFSFLARLPHSSH